MACRLIYVLLLLTAPLTSTTLFSQHSVNEQKYSLQLPERTQIVFDQKLKTPRVISFQKIAPHEQFLIKESNEKISQFFDFSGKDKLSRIKVETFANNLRIERFKRYHEGIKVEHGDYVVFSKRDTVLSIHSEHYDLTTQARSVKINEKEALAFALEALQAEIFAWQSTSQLLKEKKDLSPQMRKRLLKICDDEFPVGEIVYVKDFSRLEHEVELAYKFTIESVSPVFKDQVYVSVTDGHLMLRDPLIKHGTGETRYAGMKSFPTTKSNVSGLDTFELVGLDTVSGIHCETRSVGGLGGLPLSIAAVYALSLPIRDGDASDPCPTDMTATIDEIGDDLWMANEHHPAIFDTLASPAISCCINYTPNPGMCNEIQNDDIALDAQWGAQMVARYWKEKHNRSSFDNQSSPIYSFVHYGDAYNNAFWNGSFMTYGDGTSQQGGGNPNGDFAPFTSLDICAHEIGHAVTSSTSNLVYQKEAGALNESLSDIYSAAIERYVLDSFDANLPYDPFAIGEQVDDSDNGLPPGDPNARAIRWMDDPNTGLNPDTYNGTYYYPTEGFLCLQPNLSNDYCGVHLNSGVINKWYYLLTVGSGQLLSPGSGLGGMKAIQDDEINDLGNSYMVKGITSSKSELITFLAQSLLTPNALFNDMREASIMAAQALYGICSFEEIQTTNAWYAVGVGDTFQLCSPKIVFGNFNATTFNEDSQEIGCAARDTIELSLFSFDAFQTIEFMTSGNAIAGVDFDIVQNQMSFNGSETKTLQLKIYDDHVVESEIDTLLIFFNDGGFSDTIQLFIFDDDIIPSIGDTIVLLNETFADSVIPPGWTTQLVNIESTNEWQFTGAGLAAQKAYIGIPGSPNPSYNLAGHSHNRLISPLMDARGRSDVKISFDWRAGGEADAVESTVIFDYGTFQISTNGLEWSDIENFVGAMGGMVPDSGTYLMMHPALNNEKFFLGFKWYNDALLGSSFSFTIDNVKVTANDLDIASSPGSEMSADIPPNTLIPFVSDVESELLAFVQSGNANLGCCTVSVLSNGEQSKVPGPQCDQRSAKTIGFESNSQTDTVTISLFFKSEEVSAWANPSTLNILAVQDLDIENLQSGYNIIPTEQVIVQNELENDSPYISYTFTVETKYRSFALTDRSSEPISRIVFNTSDNDPLSLRERINASCPGDTIFFDSAIMTDTILLSGPEIMIDKNIVIIGSGIGNTFISGENNSRIFHILEDFNVQLFDMSLLNGLQNLSGTTILNEGNLSITNIHLQ